MTSPVLWPRPRAARLYHSLSCDPPGIAVKTLCAQPFHPQPYKVGSGLSCLPVMKGRQACLAMRTLWRTWPVKDVARRNGLLQNYARSEARSPGREGARRLPERRSHRSNVYRSEYAGTNKATAVTWTVDNVEEEAKALKNRGVVFEHYDMPGMTRHGGVHSGRPHEGRVVQGPDGNILNIARPMREAARGICSCGRSSTPSPFCRALHVTAI
jgi:hypothetical protein